MNSLTKEEKTRIRREIKAFRNEHMPRYFKTAMLAIVILFLAFGLLGLAAVVTVGVVYDESPVTYITMICYFAVMLLIIFAFCISCRILKKRLVEENHKNLLEELKDMPLAEAHSVLEQKGIIRGEAFAAGDDVFGSSAISFDTVTVLIYVKRSGFGFVFKGGEILGAAVFETNALEGFGEPVPLADFDLDGALYNFIMKKPLKHKCFGFGDVKDSTRLIANAAVYGRIPKKLL